MSNSGGLSALDYLEIQNLYSYYNLMSDAADAEAYASCFTDDGVMESPEIGINVTGRSDLIAHKERDKASRGGKYRRHWNGSIHLERLGDGSVRGRCYLVAYNGEPGDLPKLADCGVYEDILVKVNGAWKFARRTLTMDGSTWGKS